MYTISYSHQQIRSYFYDDQYKYTFKKVNMRDIFLNLSIHSITLSRYCVSTIQIDKVV